MKAEKAQTNNPARQMVFADISEALATAGYVEQVLSAEHQWIANRLSWLFVSQSFCITAYAIVTTSALANSGSIHVKILRIGLPVFGIVCCVAVGFAVRAATAVARKLANEGARLTNYINEQTGTMIPLVGVDKNLRDSDLRWTLRIGALPQWLPWALLILWLTLLLRVDFV